MRKAITGFVLAGLATLATASPAYADPVCQDGTADAYGGTPPTFAATNIYVSDYCDDAYQIVSVGGWPSSYVTINYDSAFIDGLYYSPETLSFTVTDGVEFATFYVTIYPHFS